MTTKKKPSRSPGEPRTARWVSLLAFLLSHASLAFGGRIAVVKPSGNPIEGSSLKINVDLILVNASVSDRRQRFVTGLGKDQFQVFEDGVQQTVTQFSNVDLPASIGLVVDTSGSMTDKIIKAKDALITFLKTSNQQDEYFLLPFANRPVLSTELTTDTARIQNRVAFMHAGGATTLYDAIYLGLEKIKQGHNAKKALLLVTDGEDTASRYSLADVRDALKEADCQIFVIGILSPGLPNDNLGFSVSDLLADMADMTGGTAFFPSSASDLPDICEQIAREIKSEYLLGYTPSNAARDGRWRKIKVRVHAPNENRSFSIHAKTGYYAPSH